MAESQRRDAKQKALEWQVIAEEEAALLGSRLDQILEDVNVLTLNVPHCT